MVRAGAVAHPKNWAWCSHAELLGERQRYRLLNTERLLQSLGVGSEQQLREWYRNAIETHLAESRLQREAHWTEALAVGSEEFVGRTALQYTNRVSVNASVVPDRDGQSWVVRDASVRYGSLSGPEMAPEPQN
jgi:putative transposase